LFRYTTLVRSLSRRRRGRRCAATPKQGGRLVSRFDFADAKLDVGPVARTSSAGDVARGSAGDPGLAFGPGKCISGNGLGVRCPASPTATRAIQRDHRVLGQTTDANGCEQAGLVRLIRKS